MFHSRFIGEVATMKELLIIRSVSFQQLDMNLKEILSTYPEYKVTLLTHEHGVKLAEKYKEIDEIVVYPYKNSFSYFRPVHELEGRLMDVVIIPVTNMTGAGFSNVLWFSLTIKARQRVICNLVSQLKGVSGLDIVFLGVKNTLYSVLAGLLSGIVGLISLPYLLLKLTRIEKKS